MSYFWSYLGPTSTGSGGSARDAERAILWQYAKTFMHPMARFAAHPFLKIPPMELNDLHISSAKERWKADGGVGPPKATKGRESCVPDAVPIKELVFHN